MISCYQHVINSRVTQAVNSSRREHFWSSLGRYLATLPFRNMLVVAGDFNCAARREDGVAGFAAPPPNSYYFDQDDFIGLAVANSLCLLNTWSRPSSQDMNTFANGSLSSQIDYVMTRKSAADSLARQSRPVPGLDFAPWRLGSKHLPVQASIRMRPHAESLRSAMINKLLRIHCDRQTLQPPTFIRTFSTQFNNSSTPLRQASTRCCFDFVKNIFHQNTRRSASGHGNRVTCSAQSETCGSLARQCSVLAGMLDLVSSR